MLPKDELSLPVERSIVKIVGTYKNVFAAMVELLRPRPLVRAFFQCCGFIWNLGKISASGILHRKIAWFWILMKNFQSGLGLPGTGKKTIYGFYGIFLTFFS